ncbi:MAG: histidine phosphatase family protein [Actinomycetia bacterium]|nr:histidine phosphatase family protein [Actinomycetes bacterium]
MTYLLLVRHGQSTWNLERRIQGQTMAVPLTDLGRDQARRAAAEVARLVPPGTTVLASDQLRAWQTAEIVAAEIGATVRAEPRLREQSLGRMEGLTEAELVPEPTPEGVDIADVRWGGGESLADVSVRLQDLLGSLATYEEVVLVSHELTLRVLLALLDGRTHRDCDFDLPMPNGAVLQRHLDRDAGLQKTQVRRLLDAHGEMEGQAETRWLRDQQLADEGR